MGKIRITVAQNAELAQSYMAHARSSGRCSPRRSSRGTWAMLASFGRASLSQPGPLVGGLVRARAAGLSFDQRHRHQEVNMLSSGLSRVALAAALASVALGRVAS